MSRAVGEIEQGCPGSVTGVRADSGVPGDLDRLLGTVADGHGRPTATAVADSIPKPVGDHIVRRVPAGRMERPAETASAVLFPASDESRFVRGTELFVDGGFAQV